MSVTCGQTAFMIAARRTPVAPRGGAFAAHQADELAAPVLAQLVTDAGLSPGDVEHIILGNALYGGGNPARLAGLRAGFPETVPAMTVDTQCCSGLDAILLGTRMIQSGAADCVLAGGAESFSRSPLRMHRPSGKQDQPVAYKRPAFAPDGFEDPDLIDAAAELAREHGVSRQAQVDFAVHSHFKARQASGGLQRRLVRVPGNPLDRDAFTRVLSAKTALRAPVLSGSHDTGLSAATIACEADAAAAVVLVSERYLAKHDRPALRVMEGKSAGGTPAEAALVPVEAAAFLLNRLNMHAGELAAVELMEAFAVQAMVTADFLELDPARLNMMGGALARGHPIGASGAILAVQLFEQLICKQKSATTAQSCGMALIAAAGGLASGLVLGTGS